KLFFLVRIFPISPQTASGSKQKNGRQGQGTSGVYPPFLSQCVKVQTGYLAQKSFRENQHRRNQAIQQEIPGNHVQSNGQRTRRSDLAGGRTWQNHQWRGLL